MLRRLFWTRARRQAGGSQVELALIAPLLIGLLVGIWDFGTALQERSRVVSAARAGLEYAVGHPDDVDDEAAIATAVRADAGADGEALGIASRRYCQCADGSTVACNGTCNAGAAPRKYVRIEVRRDYRTLLPYPFVKNPIGLTEIATMRVQ